MTVITSCTVDVSEFNWLVATSETKEFVRRFYDINWTFNADPGIIVAPISENSFLPWYASLANNPTCIVQTPVNVSSTRKVYDGNGQILQAD